jgi:spermidine/putrescine transport system ATP-binding protein
MKNPLFRVYYEETAGIEQDRLLENVALSFFKANKLFLFRHLCVEQRGMLFMQKENIVQLKDIVVAFDGETVLDNLSLDIKDKEFITFLGPSGCGKTTTLRLIAGFLEPDKGEVVFEGKKINGVPAYKRQVNTIFQRYALFPHLNVYENVAFGLKVKKLPKAEIKEKVTEMLALVNLSGFEKRSIDTLSGGQQQRVAIARAIANHPKVLLLDEPLAALDLKLRKDMQKELKKIQQQLGITFIFVTHDQEEALTMSDRVVVMDNGKIQQVGTPQDIYNEPLNAFVADFIGESNIVDGVMLRDYFVEFSGAKFDCLDKGFKENESVDVVVRPEDVDIVPVDKGMLKGVVTSVSFLGVHYEIIVDIGGFKWMIQTTDEHFVDDKVGLYIEPDAIHIMKKSEYSGLYGDYSTYSEEIDLLSETQEVAD